MIAQYGENDHRRWDEHLSQIKFAFNIARNEETGFTPAYLNYGQELARPRPAKRGKTQPREQANIQQKLDETYELARIHMVRAF